MSENSSGTTTIVFTFLISFLGLFGAIVFGGIIWQRRHPQTRHLRFLQDASTSSPSLLLEKPLLWDVFVQMRDVKGTAWTSLLPMSLHITNNVPSISTHAPVDSAEHFWNHITGAQGSSWRHLAGSMHTEKPQTTTNSTPDTSPDFHVSFLIAMPSPHKDLSSPLRTEYVLGTEQVVLHEYDLQQGER